MEIFWSALAKSHLSEIFDHYNEVAGSKVAQTIIQKIVLKPKILSSYPESGQKEEIISVKIRGYRYLVEGN